MADKALSISRRTRATPFSRRVEAAGVRGYTVYNHMLLPTYFESNEFDYWSTDSRVLLLSGDYALNERWT